ncbi:MAG: class II aldolase/adducin family protein [Gammaproteobacteria bacterium]
MVTDQTPADLVRIYRRMREYGLNDTHSGNASIRVGSGIWITPHGAWAEELGVEDLVRVEFEAPQPEDASWDTPLHLATYRENPEHGAVLHGHGLYGVAMSLEVGDFFEPVDFEGRLLFPRVAIIDVSAEHPFEDAARLTARALRDLPLTIVRGHGIYSAGPSLEIAWRNLASLEWSAHLAWLRRGR